MRILIVTTSFPQVGDGSEAAGGFVRDFAKKLVTKSTVAVVAPGQEAGREITENVLVYRYWAPSQPLSTLKLLNPFDWLKVLRTYFNGQKIVLEAAEHFKPDFILALWVMPPGLWARRASRKLDVPYATWALGSDIWKLSRIPFIKLTLKSVIRQASASFADGYGLADDVRYLSDKPCEFLASARELPVCGTSVQLKPPYRLLYLGRWHENKGIDLLMEALLDLDQEIWEGIEEVRVAGGGPLAKVVQEKCAELQRHGRPVAMLGFQDAQQAANLLVWSDAVIVPSRIESVPVIYSDAIQARRIVLATPVGDFPRLAKLKEGREFLRLAESTDVRSLIKILGEFVTKPNSEPVPQNYRSPLEASVESLLSIAGNQQEGGGFKSS
ncbi:MAG: glycosyltransferase [bacterium]